MEILKTDILKQSLRGSLIERCDPGYPEACKLYNGMIDKRPLMVIRCADVADVMAIVTFRTGQSSPARGPRRRP